MTNDTLFLQASVESVMSWQSVAWSRLRLNTIMSVFGVGAYRVRRMAFGVIPEISI
jgi:hypothetical protein